MKRIILPLCALLLLLLPACGEEEVVDPRSEERRVGEKVSHQV